MYIIREEEVVPPINDLPVNIMGILGAEWWVSYLLAPSWCKRERHTD